MSDCSAVRSRENSPIPLDVQFPTEKDIVLEVDRRGPEFEEYMKTKGFSIDRYPHKILTSWADNKYFDRSVEEHVQDFKNPGSEAEERDWAQRRQESLESAFVPRLIRGKSTPSDFLRIKSKIRLLVLKPLGRRFSCHLRVVQLEDAIGKYEALSYCWEGSKKRKASQSAGQNAHDQESIICNGLPMPLKENLYSALRKLRFQRFSRILWIDAICINQKDNCERASQVQIMGNIYRNASRVIIWLGDIEPCKSARGFDTVCNLVNIWDRTASALYHTKLRLKQECDDRPARRPYVFNSLDFVPIFEANWFERRWVLQEAVLAREAIVVVPGASISWKWIMVASGILRTRHLPAIIGKRIHTNVCNAYLMARLSGSMALPPLKPKFLHLLRLTTEFKATEPLDIVYGLYGLVSDTNQTARELLPPVDYTWTPEELMPQITETFISLPNPLAFLSDAGGDQSPSWLPHYGQKNYTMLDPWAMDGSAFNPAAKLPFKRWPTENKSELVVEGIPFSPVVETFPLLFDRDQRNQTMVRLLTLAQTFKPDIGDFKRLSVLSRTLTGSRDSYGQRNHNQSDFARDFADFLFEWQRSYKADSGLLGFMHLRELKFDGQFERFVEVARMICGRRSLFVTESGHLGLGPDALRIGDVVYALAGAPMLHLLRSTSVGYRLIGGCFIDGLMDGEMVDMLDNAALLEKYSVISGSGEPASPNLPRVCVVTLI